MRLKPVLLIIAVFVAIIAGAKPTLASAQQPVIIVQIKGEINGGQAALVHKAVVEASNQEAQALVLEVDTFGGLVDSAVSIRDLVIDCKLPTICHIKNRAWSAGALIALAHKHIAIAPGGSIGAAEPIPATEKTIAALKAEFAATANKTGRDPRIAEAMVDKTLGYQKYAEPGQILALTDYQAIEVKYADFIAADRQALLEHYGLAQAPVIELQSGWSERAAGWLSNATVKSLLLSVIFLAVLTEIKTAGAGVAAFIGLAAALLFFGSQWLTGFAGWLEILLFCGGLLLIVLEMYTPGAGFFGISGLLAILASLFFTLGGGVGALNVLALSIVVAVVVFALILKRLPNSKLWSKLILHQAETTLEGFVSANDYRFFLGKTGTVITLLRPAGVVDVEGTHLDVVSEGQFIRTGVTVEVIKVNGARIVVRPVNNKEEM